MEHFQSPCPVDKVSFGGIDDLIGNVWQWTETPISGFEGFKIHDVRRLHQSVGSLPYNDPKLLFPIPAREIEANPNLKPQQNPGY